MRSASGVRRRPCPSWTGVLAGAVVLVLANGGMRGQLLKPLFIVLMQTVLVVIDENGCSDVHGIHKGQYPLSYTTLMPLAAEAIAAIGRALSNPT